MLVREIITAAFHELQVYAPDEDVSLVDLAKGFQALNVMLDSWSTENMTCFAVLEQTIALKPGVPQYTIGPGGTIDTSKSGQRPIKLIGGPGTAYIQDGQGNNYPVNVVNQAQWNAIGNRVVSNSNFPDTLFYDPQFPTAFVNVFPVPNQANTLFFDSYLQLQRFSSIDLDINLPPGYAKALQHNVAIELAPTYAVAKLSKTTTDLARFAKANVKRANGDSLLAQFDPELTPNAPGVYNIYTDNYSTNTSQ